MKKVLIGLLALLVLGGGAAGYLYWSTSQKVDAFEKTAFGKPEPVTVVIPKGTDPVAVGELLAHTGVVADGETWHLWLRWRKLNPKLKAGEYEFTGPMTPPQIAAKLQKGEVKQHHFTVAEGLRCEEIMPVIAGTDLGLDLAKLQSLCTDRGFARSHGIPADRIEGYLFPDTYSFPLGVTETAVVSKMISRAREELARAAAHRSPEVKLDAHQALTLASIVEKETGASDERPHISCLFHNRLKKHIKLQTDPTVLYGMYVKTGKFNRDLAFHGFVAAREDVNAYNTYVVDGLPAGPISNPGAAAIQAAYSPSSCSDIFFVARGDGSGHHIFCPDAGCHEKAVKQYVAAVRH